MEMYNDELDQYSRMAAGDNQDGDAVLRAALEARKQQNREPSNPATPSSIRSGRSGVEKALNGGVVLGNGDVSVRSASSNNSRYHSNNGHASGHPQGHMNITAPSQSHVDIFDNRGFEMQATEI